MFILNLSFLSRREVLWAYVSNLFCRADTAEDVMQPVPRQQDQDFDTREP